jgi:enamine deaminase RidA (YjgF/YER057c/UK114 family)
MDNFMDRLTKRFNAGELIQANGEAEARENERLRKQTAEYEKMMQEIRRLNLKTVEVSEQVSQMLSCGIEQLEEYEVKLHGLIKEEETDKTEAAADAQQINQVITQELAQQKKELDLQIAGMQELMDAQLKNLQDSMGVQLSGADEKLLGVDNRISGVDEKLLGVSDRLSGVDEKLTDVGDRLFGADEKLTDVGDRLSGVDEKLTDVGDRFSSVDEKLTGVDGAVEKLLAENAQSLAMLKEWNEQKQQGSQTETLDTVRAVEDKLEHLSGNIADNAIRQHSLLQDMAVNTENALQDLTRTTEDALQNLQNKLEQQKPADNAELIEATGQIKEMIVNIRLYLDDVQKHIEDYVHKEDVKVYRNVQAVLMEQLSNKTRDLNDHMDALEKSVQKSKGTKPLLVFAILLSAASLTIQILQMLGIL